jgi:hypothetical protein
MCPTGFHFYLDPQRINAILGIVKRAGLRYSSDLSPTPFRCCSNGLQVPLDAVSNVSPRTLGISTTFPLKSQICVY